MDKSCGQSQVKQKRSLLRPYAGQEPKIEILNFDAYQRDNSLLTLVLREEDHTIGNALTEILSGMEDVEFAGYNVPHPLEDKILVRIQMRQGASAGSALLRALKDMDDVFQTVKERFLEAYAEHKNST